MLVGWSCSGKTAPGSTRQFHAPSPKSGRPGRRRQPNERTRRTEQPAAGRSQRSTTASGRKAIFGWTSSPVLRARHRRHAATANDARAYDSARMRTRTPTPPPSHSRRSAETSIDHPRGSSVQLASCTGHESPRECGHSITNLGRVRDASSARLDRRHSSATTSARCKGRLSSSGRSRGDPGTRQPEPISTTRRSACRGYDFRRIVTVDDQGRWSARRVALADRCREHGRVRAAAVRPCGRGQGDDLPDGCGRYAKINPSTEVFGETRPASTLVEISRLAIPGAKIEVEAIARVLR